MKHSYTCALCDPDEQHPDVDWCHKCVDLRIGLGAPPRQTQMVREIKAVLLVPPMGDPLGLLAAGPCGACPPTAWIRTYPRVVHEGNRFADPTIPCEICRACGQQWPCDTPGKVEYERFVRWNPGDSNAWSLQVANALVLAWDGKPAREGMDRLDWCRAKPNTIPGRVRASNFVPDHPNVPTTLLRPYESGWMAAHGGDSKGIPGLGTLVLLDAEGREVNSDE
jgi:hypothetical protein